MAVVTLLKKVRASGTAAALSLLMFLPAVAAAQGATQPRSADSLEPGDSLEGNYLAAIVAGASRDLGAASVLRPAASRISPA